MVLGYEIRHRKCRGEIKRFSCTKCKERWGIWEGLWTSDFYWIKVPAKGKQTKGKAKSLRSRIPVGYRRLIAAVLVVGVLVGVYFLGNLVQKGIGG